MELKIWLLLSLIAIAGGSFTCSDSDCHECYNCNDCIGETCNLSCQGGSCRDCPTGDCCNGNNCNVCTASVCCSTANCNQCVKEQRKLCSNELSSSQCSSKITQKCGLNNEEQHSSNVNSYHHNVTTIIKIRNLINNTNMISAPIELNLTNTNDMILNTPNNTLLNNTNNGVVLNRPNNLLLRNLDRSRRKCCSIVHPQECHMVPNLPKEICFTRRHSECSDLCNNGTHLLITTSRTKRCIYIAVHPYYYCGYYAVEDCSACFNCAKEKISQCLEETTCSRTCRSTILPRRFYNIPYYIKRGRDPPRQ